MESPDFNARFVRNPNLVSTDMDGEKVMMSIDEGCYYGMKGVAARTWDLLETPRTLQEVCTQLCTEYEVDEATCRSDLSAFASELIERSLLQRC